MDDFCLALIDEAHVVSVPGSIFGVDECLRFSYAVEETVFAEGMRRIKKFMKIEFKIKLIRNNKKSKLLSLLFLFILNSNLRKHLNLFYADK